MKGLTLNKEPKVGDPDTTRERYGELVPVPNGDAGGAHERFLSREDGHIAEIQTSTYMRSTIKSEAAAKATYPES